MNNQRQIGAFLDFYATDNDGRYPESVATIGTDSRWHWQEPSMLTGYEKRSPKLRRSISAYLRSYIGGAGTLFCPNAPKKYKYLQESWDAGDKWDNPDTGPVPDPVFGTYCFYWNYVGYLEGRGVFKGPTDPAGGPGQGRVLVSDYFGYNHWRSPEAFGSCEKFSGADVAEGTWVSSAFWCREGPCDAAGLERLEIKLSACYTDGHVGSYRPSEVVPMKVSLSADGTIPYPDGVGSGILYLPAEGVR